MTNQIFYELLQVAIGRRTALSHTPTAKEWEEMYRMAESQAVLGVCFAGVKRLQETHQGMPTPLYMQWLAMAAKIQQRNEDMDRKTAEVWALLNKAGLECAVLKGQGVAELYDAYSRPLPKKRVDKNPFPSGEGWGEALDHLRQSGDIDVWVKGGFDVVNDFVQKTRPTDDIAYHRFHYNMYADTEVELHHRPTLMRNLFDDKRLQQWCDSFGSDTFVMTDKGFAVPSLEFNRIFILTHIYRHFLFEGIGLRQLMDYYFVLRARNNNLNLDLNLNKLLRELRLMRFAAAVMWVLGHVFGLKREYMLCEPNEKEGRFILNEIMQTGNFGHGDTRYLGYGKLKRMSRHGLHLLLHYPSEVIWTPIWLVYHRIWKANKKRRINFEL